MKIFIDSAKIDEIKEFVEIGIVEGCTTNPKFLGELNFVSLSDLIRNICSIVNGPVSVQVTVENAKEMVKQALEYSSIAENVVVKLPATTEGYKALKIIKSEYKNIKTNVTACYTASQVLMAAKLNSDYASLFFNRIKDIGKDPVKEIELSKKLLENFSTKLIIGSIRSIDDVSLISSLNVDVITIPYKILKQIFNFEPTINTISEFLRVFRKEV